MAVRLEAQTDAGAEKGEVREPSRLTQLIDFWSVSLASREAGIPYEFEVDVLYYDPFWTILQVEDASLSEYLESVPDLAIKSGRRIRLKGETSAPASVFSVAGADIVDVGAAQINWAKVDLSQIDHHAMINRPIEVFGLVEGQEFDAIIIYT